MRLPFKLTHRNGDDKGCADADFALDGDTAAMQLNCMSRDDQPQPGSSNMPDISRPVKRLEQMRLIGFGNADARIGNLENDGGTMSTDVEADAFPVR